MLGVTQTVDMVTSLRQAYGWVEVVVLNVDLLSNMIDTVVIADRLYSLPIQVEGRDDNEEVEAQMDLDDGGNGIANGSDKSGESSEKNGSCGRDNRDQAEGSGQRNDHSSGSKQVNGSTKERAVQHDKGQGAVDNANLSEYNIQTGNSSLNFNQRTYVHNNAAQNFNTEATEPITFAGQTEDETHSTDDMVQAYV
jgi:hypothetical protein